MRYGKGKFSLQSILKLIIEQWIRNPEVSYELYKCKKNKVYTLKNSKSMTYKTAIKDDVKSIIRKMARGTKNNVLACPLKCNLPS